ncbi:Bax inhibitor-1 family protein [Gammaproteobacteria bacterium]|nr:Bax inhibitor-1 family protein [Gammaproteobacteria bacterium]
MATAADIKLKLKSFRWNVLLRFMALNASTPIGIIIAYYLLPFSLMMNFGVQILLSISWLICATCYITNLYRRTNTPIIADAVMGLLTGIFISGVVISALVIDPVALIFAASTVFSVLMTSFLYALVSSQPRLDFLNRNRILKAVGLTTTSGLLIYAGFLLTAVLTGSPALIFIDAVFFGGLAAAGIVAMMHKLVKNTHEEYLNTNPAKVAFSLYLDVLDLFINVLRAYNAAKNSKSGKGPSWQKLTQVGVFVFGVGYLAYLMVSGKLFEINESDQPSRAKRVNAYRARPNRDTWQADSQWQVPANG